MFAVCPWILSGPNDEAWYGYTEKTETVQAVMSLGEFVRETDHPPQPRAKGFDASSHQKTIDWTRAAKGYDFCFIRASAGLTKDTFYDRNQREAEKQGLLRGAYHFLRADEDAVAQARLFAQVITSSNLEIMPMLDIEYWEPAGSLTQSMIETFVTTFGEELGCYTSVWQWDDKLRLQGNGGMPVLWVADYVHADAPQLPSGWKEWEFWQYTSGGAVDGIEGNVDLNRFHGTVEELKAKYAKDTAFEIIMPMVAEALKDIPMPSEFALPAKAESIGYPIQLPIHGAVAIDGVNWAYQVFTRPAQDKYIVCYCKAGDWQNVRWREVVRDT